MKIFELDELTEDERTTLGHFFNINKRFINFGNSCTQQTFIDLFGDPDGVRLWEKFVRDCDRNPVKWLTYLSDDQTNIFWVQLTKYVNLTKGILTGDSGTWE